VAEKAAIHVAVGTGERHNNANRKKAEERSDSVDDDLHDADRVFVIY
jgi:hypothetical protein